MAIHIRTSWLLLPALAIGAAAIGAATISRADLAWFFARVPPERAAGESAPPALMPEPAINRGMMPAPPASPRQAEPEPPVQPPSSIAAARTPTLPAARPAVERVEISASRAEPDPVTTASPPAPQPGETRDAIAIRRVAPRYDPTLVALKIEGTARVRAEIDTGGAVVSAKAVSGGAEGVFAEVAMRAWRFAPALKNGVPVPSVVLVDFVFTLK